MTMLLATVLSVMASFFSAVPLDKTGTSGSEFRSINAKDLENQAILEHRSNTAERKGLSRFASRRFLIPRRAGDPRCENLEKPASC